MAGVLTLRIHVYALYPISDGKSTSHTTPTHERVVMCATSSTVHSPRSRPKVARKTPAHSICSPLASADDCGSGVCRANIDPAAQLSVPTSTTSSPVTTAALLPPNASGPTSSATPAAPVSSPITTSPVGRVPPGRSHSISTNQTGVIATISATRPDALVNSAKVTAPLPTQSISNPRIAHERISRAEGRSAPREAAHAVRITPATNMRLPAIRKGGMLAIAHAMPR